MIMMMIQSLNLNTHFNKQTNKQINNKKKQKNLRKPERFIYKYTSVKQNSKQKKIRIYILK
jgi:hypothetical protein